MNQTFTRTQSRSSLAGFLVFAAAAMLMPSGYAASLSQDMSSSLPPISYRLVHPQFPASCSVVASYTDSDLKLDRTGTQDSSTGIQAALDAIGNAGGGSLFLSAGTYRLDHVLTLPRAVTLRGEIGATSDPYRYHGTILAAYAGRGEADGAPLVTLRSSSCIRNCIIWYPAQRPDAVVPYPPAVDHVEATTTLDNVVFVNAYQAYRSGYSMSGRAYVRNLRGTALKVGVEIDGLADTGRVENVTLSPEYWSHSGLAGSPADIGTGYREFMRSQGVGILERRIDWTNTANVDIDGYDKGFDTEYSKNEEDMTRGHFTVAPNGECFEYRIRNCNYGLYLNCDANSGLIFTNFDIQATKCGVYLSPQCDCIATLLNDTIDCPATSLQNDGPGRLLVRDCHFRSGQITLNAGINDFVASTYSPSSFVVATNDGLTKALFAGDVFAKPVSVTGTGKSVVEISTAPATPTPPFNPPPIDYEAPHGSTTGALYNVADAPYNAVADGKTDCTSAFRSALHAARASGGGIVFAPPGVYCVTGSLTVPSGVELRGAFDSPHDATTAGTCLMITDAPSSADGTATLNLMAGSTLRGVNVHYQQQQEASTTDFPFLVRGDGAGISIENVASDNVSRFIDLMTNRCDDAYIDHIEGQPINVGVEIGGGSRNVVVSDCQFNPSNWTFSDLFNAPKVVYANDPKQRGIVNEAYTEKMQESGEQFVLGDCTNLRFYRDFVFAGRYGIRCVAQNGRGPSGYCLEPGVDGSTTAMRVDAIGAGGFPIVNAQLVVTSKLQGERHDLEIGPAFTGTALVYGVDMWGARADSSVQALAGTLILQGAHLRDPGNPAIDLGANGKVYMSASCVRRNNAVLPVASARGIFVSNGCIFPDAGAQTASIDAGENMFYTDPDSLPQAAR